MQSVYKLVSTVNQFYREINPSTLSGAIDVIVVKKPNGELACSPFHVRFGKLMVLRPQEKKVEIVVNGKVVDFPMKIGEAGEAFFVFETENHVPEELRTSPLAGPSQPLPTEEEPDFLDLNTDSSKESVSKNKVEQNNAIGSDFGTEDDYEGDAEPKVFVAEPEHMSRMKVDTPSEIITPASPTSEEGTITDEVTTPTTIPDEYDDESNKAILNADIIHEVNERLAVNNQDIKLESNTSNLVFSINDDERDSLAKLHLETEIVLKDGEDANQPNRENNNKLNLNDIVSVSDLKKDESDLEVQFNDVMATQKKNGELETEISRQNRERALSMPPVHPNWEKSEGPFSDTELEETRKPEKPLERRTSRTSPLSDTELEYDPKKPTKDSGEWSWRWGALPVRKSEKIEHWQDGVDDKDWGNDNTAEKESGIEIGGNFHHFEISLCGSEDFGRDEEIDAEMFRKNQITYEFFSKSPRILNDKSLVVKYNSRYYSWQSAAPIIASLLVFQKPLPDSTVTDLYNNKCRSSDQRRYSLRGWSRWWSRSSSPLPIEAPVKVDDKPKNDVEKEEEKPTKFYAKTLRLTSEQLKSLNLKKGANTISFSVASYQKKATCIAKLFFWDYDTQIVISDIDGTITKSDALGHVFTMIGRDWTHSGVAKLYTDITRNGYQILYLTSRAIGQADYTRDYLKKVEQDKYQLPDGPVIMSPDRLLTAFHREVIMRKPEVFKMACLRDVQKLFGDRNPFFAGFGNRITDALSYRSVNVPPSRIFTIDSNGEVILELLSGYRSSYVDLSDLVDQMFPHIGGRKWDTVYNDWNYWKPPLPDIEIPLEIYENQSTTPSSPRSSAVTIGSPRLGMIRNLTGSITGSNSNNPTISAHGVLESPGNHLLNKTNGNDSVITNQRIVYVGGDVDMPGRMDIYSDENASMVGYDDEIDDGDDEGEYENDDEDDDEGEDDDEIDYIPTDIDLSSIPY
ncbi:LNS2-domain-containing protein [Rhizophagus irregularis]|uniref:phosphatidate phosphatase n=1 Tax=Rhizophagus irregularis TaxID=588596 RepID=A0A2I1ECI4_9GLOM|nr:LNS2-domain-containing protein [Rhizophagus irregularis]PKY19840.1 LNS2-domain-containing protein [Rhizophagus irregularis]